MTAAKGVANASVCRARGMKAGAKREDVRPWVRICSPRASLRHFPLPFPSFRLAVLLAMLSVAPTHSRQCFDSGCSFLRSGYTGDYVNYPSFNKDHYDIYNETGVVARRTESADGGNY